MKYGDIAPCSLCNERLFIRHTVWKDGKVYEMCSDCFGRFIASKTLLTSVKFLVHGRMPTEPGLIPHAVIDHVRRSP